MKRQVVRLYINATPTRGGESHNGLCVEGPGDKSFPSNKTSSFSLIASFSMMLQIVVPLRRRRRRNLTAADRRLKLTAVQTEMALLPPDAGQLESVIRLESGEECRPERQGGDGEE